MRIVALASKGEPRPAKGEHIEYPGGNSFYVSEPVEDALREMDEEPRKDRLHPYLIRYAVMYFDYFFEAPAREHLHRLRQDFFARKREAFARASQRKDNEELNRAERIFGHSLAELKKMDRRRVIRIYRERAKEMHPDRGGSQAEFVELTRVYKSLLRILKS